MSSGQSHTSKSTTGINNTSDSMPKTHIYIFWSQFPELSAVSDPDCRESHRKIPCQKEEGWKDVEANEGKGGRIQTTGERGIGGRGVWREAVMLSESLGG